MILEAGLRVVPNQRYRSSTTTFPTEAYVAQYAALVDARPDAGMAYGRLDVSPDSFLEEAILTVFYAERADESEAGRHGGTSLVASTTARCSGSSAMIGKLLRHRGA